MIFNLNFFSLLMTQLSTNLAFSFYTMAMTYYVYSLTNSVFYSSLITFISVGSKIISGLAISSITERIKVKNLLIFNNIFQILCMIILVICITYNINLVVIYIVISALSFVNGIFTPLKSRILKESLDNDNMAKGLSVITSLDQILLFSGWVLGAWIISLIGNNNLLLISLVLLLISLIAVINIKIKNVKEELQSKNPIATIFNSFTLLNSKPMIRNLIIIKCIEVLIGSIWIGSVTLKFVQVHLNHDVTWWGYINASYYLGTILGAVLVMKYSEAFNKKPIQKIIIFMSIYGILLILYSFNTIDVLALLLVILVGPVLQIKDIIQESFFINNINEKELIKITGLKNALVQISFLFSILIVGYITELIEVNYIYTISGVITCLIGIVFSKYRNTVNHY
nr:MFS transporter [Mammaliicoccus sp. Marseille-Q6498]